MADHAHPGSAPVAEPTPAEVDARLRDDLAALDARTRAGGMTDEQLHALLGWLGAWCWPFSTDQHVKLSPDQHASVKAVAARAVAARGGEFVVGVFKWVSDGESLRAMASDVEQ